MNEEVIDVDVSANPELPVKDLPNATAALVLGIVSIPTCLCCYGAVGLICGIIAIVMGNKAMQEYESNSHRYKEGGYKNARAGKICGLIGLILSAIVFVLMMILFATGMMSGIMNDLENANF